MLRRMAVALFALLGLLLSVYLTLHQLGLLGNLACGPGGGCEKVQASRWAWVGPIPVAAIGVGGYVAILAAALAGLQERWLASPAPARWLLGLSGGGVLFTVYLMALEAFVIHAWCRWCLVSAAIIGLIFVIAVLDWRAARGAGAAQPSLSS
jgi:uncharacterized membrane protein